MINMRQVPEVIIGDIYTCVLSSHIRPSSNLNHIILRDLQICALSTLLVVEYGNMKHQTPTTCLDVQRDLSTIPVVDNGDIRYRHTIPRDWQCEMRTTRPKWQEEV